MSAGRARDLRVLFLRQGDRHAANNRGLELPPAGRQARCSIQANSGQGTLCDTGTQGRKSLEHRVH
eukprot:11922561-Alexandrium_andersonii.AAC.1